MSGRGVVGGFFNGGFDDIVFGKTVGCLALESFAGEEVHAVFVLGAGADLSNLARVETGLGRYFIFAPDFDNDADVVTDSEFGLWLSCRVDCS